MNPASKILKIYLFLNFSLTNSITSASSSSKSSDRTLTPCQKLEKEINLKIQKLSSTNIEDFIDKYTNRPILSPPICDEFGLFEIMQLGYEGVSCVDRWSGVLDKSLIWNADLYECVRVHYETTTSSQQTTRSQESSTVETSSTAETEISLEPKSEKFIQTEVSSSFRSRINFCPLAALFIFFHA